METPCKVPLGRWEVPLGQREIPLPGAGSGPLRGHRARGRGLGAGEPHPVGHVDGLDEDVILESMRGKAGGDKWQPPQSIKDTLADRSLEKLMNFDKMIEQDGGGDPRIDLPEFDDVIARRRARLGEDVVYRIIPALYFLDLY